jgi:hypothetical protein
MTAGFLKKFPANAEIRFFAEPPFRDFARIQLLGEFFSRIPRNPDSGGVRKLGFHGIQTSGEAPELRFRRI